jgi:ABC-type nitrate/sulfonate/bicarbonate transport system ATPase subunit
VTKRFADTVAVDDLDAGIEQGGFFAMLGPSCCGRRRRCGMIGGFESPHRRNRLPRRGGRRRGRRENAAVALPVAEAPAAG